MKSRVLLACLTLVLVTGCQQQKPATTSNAAVPAQPVAKAPAPSPPDTAYGRLVHAEVTDRYPTLVLNMRCAGGMCEEMVKPPKGKTTYRLRFEGAKTMPAEERMTMVDAAQKKYRLAGSRKEKTLIAFYFVVPEDASGLQWTDGKQSLPVDELLKLPPAEATRTD